MVIPCVTGQDPHALAAGDGVRAFGDEHGVISVVPEHAGGSEHLPRAGEIQFPGAVEDQQSVSRHVHSLVDRNRFR